MQEKEMLEKKIIYNKLKKILDYKDKLDYYYNTIEKIFGCNVDKGFFDIAYKIFEEYYECAETELIGTNTYYVISWYIYDNSCGEAGLSWEINNRLYKICNINDLVDLIIILRTDNTDVSFFTDVAINQPTLFNVCMNYRHDFGLLSDTEKERYKDIAVAWKNAWDKELK
jgi:hypothetical protein